MIDKILVESIKRALRGYGLECCLCFLSFLLSKRKNKNKPQDTGKTLLILQSIFLTKNHLKIAGAFGLSSFTYKTLTSLINSFSNNDIENKPNPLKFILKRAFACYIATFWLYKINSSYRSRISTYLFIRSCYDLFRFFSNEKYIESKSMSNNVKLEKNDSETKPGITSNRLYYILNRLANSKNITYYVWMFEMIFIGYCLYHDPQLFDPSYYRLCLKQGRNTDEQMRMVFRSQIDPESKVRLPSEPFVPCVPLWHKEPSCFKFHMKNWLTSVIFFTKMYGLVHFVPLLMSTRTYKLIQAAIQNKQISKKWKSQQKQKQIISMAKAESKENLSDYDDDNDNDNDDGMDTGDKKEDIEEIQEQDEDENEEEEEETETENARLALLRLIKRKLIGVIRSTLFFSSFQHWTKLLQCWMRDIIKSDAIPFTILWTMIIAPISFSFETKSRHVDYILYVFTQMVTSLGRLIKRLFPKFYMNNIRHRWSLTLMQLAYVCWSILQSMEGGTKYIGRLNMLAMKMVL